MLKSANSVYQTLGNFNFCFSASIDKLYAFIFTQSDDTPKSYGWEMYDTQTEYLRLGVPNELWVLTNINKDYEVILKEIQK